MSARTLGMIVVGFVLAACGKSAGAPDAGPTPQTSAAPTTIEDVAAPVDEVAVPAPEVGGDKDPTTLALERVAALAVPGMAQARSQLQSDHVTVVFDTAPNAKGNGATVEMTLSACRDCAVPALQDVEAQREQILAGLGELHAKSADLVFDIAALELLPQRTGVAVYTRSFVADGITRATLHTLDVSFGENGFVFRFQAYPRSAMPATADEHASGFTRAELEAAVKAVFSAANAAVYQQR